jgi:hypothetical protein
MSITCLVEWAGNVPTYVIVIIAPTVIYAAMMGAWRLVFGEWIG